MLEYFYKNDINIHQAEVITFADPRHTFPKLKTEEFFLMNMTQHCIVSQPAEFL